jgi:lecithin:retinol acyltransferase
MKTRLAARRFFWHPSVDPSQPGDPPDAFNALRDLNPAPAALRAVGLPEVANPFLVRFKGEDPTRPIQPLGDVPGWEWEQSPDEFREEQRLKSTDVYLTTRKAGDFGLVGLVAERGGYEHLGVAIGDGTVVHFTGAGWKRLAVARTTVATFQQTSTIRPTYPDITWRLNAGISALIALRFVGLRGYNLLWRNCDHFLTFVLAGEWRSFQVERLRSNPLKAVRDHVKRWVHRTTPSAAEEEELRPHLEWGGTHPSKNFKRFLLPPDGTRVPFWLGDLWLHSSDRIVFHTWTRVSWDEWNLDITVPSLIGGWWAAGPPFEAGIWSLKKPEGRLAHLGELWMDDYLRPYVRGWFEPGQGKQRIRRWYKIDRDVDLATCLPPLPGAYPRLPRIPRYPESVQL